MLLIQIKEIENKVLEEIKNKTPNKRWKEFRKNPANQIKRRMTIESKVLSKISDIMTNILPKYKVYNHCIMSTTLLWNVESNYITRKETQNRKAKNNWKRLKKKKKDRHGSEKGLR